MKKIFLLFTLLSLLQLSHAQRTIYHAAPEMLFNRGKEMFLEGNCEGAEDMLTPSSFKTRLKEEAAYMLSVSSFRRGKTESGEKLMEFIESYPESVHRHPVYFLLGSYHYDRKEWEEARNQFQEADLDYLTLSEQEDYSFRLGYTELQLGNLEEARRLFGLLSLNSKRYRDAPTHLGSIITVKECHSIATISTFATSSQSREEVAFLSRLPSSTTTGGGNPISWLKYPKATTGLDEPQGT